MRTTKGFVWLKAVESSDCDDDPPPSALEGGSLDNMVLVPRAAKPELLDTLSFRVKGFVMLFENKAVGTGTIDA